MREKTKVILSSTNDPWCVPLPDKYSKAYMVSFLQRFISKIKAEVKTRQITLQKCPKISKE
jgi:hypothetical protein